MAGRQGHTNKEVLKTLIFGYLSEPVETRLALPKFLKLHRMHKRTFFNWEGEFKSITKQEKENHKTDLKNTVLDAWDVVEGKDPKERRAKQNSQDWLEKKGGEINEALVNSCKSGNAQALKLYFQLTNQLVEKQEVTVGLTPDEITRRNLEAERQLREGGY